MELNIEKKQQLEKLLARPALVTQEHIPFLQNLVEDYPYFQPLHLLLAKASHGNTEQQSTLTKAALYTNGGILHRLLHEPHLQAIEELVVVNNPVWNHQQQISIIAKTAEEIPATLPANTSEPAKITDAPEIENLEPLPHEVILKEPTQEQEKLTVIEPNLTPVAEETKTTPQDFIAPEIENLDPLPNEVIKVCEPTIAINNESVAEEVEVKEADDQEIFEEIGEVTLADLHSPQTDPEENLEENLAEEEQEEVEIAEGELFVEPKIDGETDKAEHHESLTKANFFAFDPSFETEAAPEKEEAIDEIEELSAPPPLENPADEISAKENIISKYDDDKLPFTFLWWLAKTRKDHEQIFRPFASPAKANSPTPDLQQQYIENIFHIQAPFEPGQEVQAPTTESTTKESKIIDSFIKNDPQIKALKPHQINNENKAKRSAEDNYDMVSETLAQIYIEQMLYHKAIDTYQKLSLKFPEKSRYFADLIQSLEKKI